MSNELQPRLMRMRQLVDYCALSKASLYLKISEGDFPNGYFISPGVRVWERTEVDNWLDKKLKTLPTT